MHLSKERLMMRNLAVELGPLGITVNNVAPGAIEILINKDLLNNPEKLDNMVLKNIPLGRLGKSEDVAGLVAFPASDADYITGFTFYVEVDHCGTTKSSGVTANEVLPWKKQKNKKCWQVSCIMLPIAT